MDRIIVTIAVVILGLVLALLFLIGANGSFDKPFLLGDVSFFWTVLGNMSYCATAVANSIGWAAIRCTVGSLPELSVQN